MTTETSPHESKKRRFSALDYGMVALAICSCAAPFVARLQVDAHASAPQIAERADILPSGGIATLNHDSNAAEAAFLEAIADPLAVPLGSKANFDLAMQQEQDVSLEIVPLPADETTVELHVIPSVTTSVSVLSLQLNYDIAPYADVSDTPPPKAAAVQRPSPEVDARKLAPLKTPVPIFRKNKPEVVENTDDIAIKRTADPSLNNAQSDYSDIVEALLDPLDHASPIETVALAVDDNVDVLAPESGQSDINSGESLLPEPQASIIAKPVTPAPHSAPVVTAQLPISQAVRPAPTPARPPLTIKNGPKIALVIAAAGFNANVTRYAIEKLPAGITLAFAPVKTDVASLAREAKADGHTILVEIPMEPVNRTRDPGPLTLRVEDTAQDNLARLNQALSRVPVADGASSYLGAKFNANPRAATPIVQALAQKGLFFFENEPTSRSVFKRLSATSRLPYARGVVKIDRGRGSAPIREALDALERQARQQGYAIGVGTTLRGTISTVALWAKAAEKRGVQFVPITELAR